MPIEFRCYVRIKRAIHLLYILNNSKDPAKLPNYRAAVSFIRASVSYFRAAVSYFRASESRFTRFSELISTPITRKLSISPLILVR